MIDDKTMTVSDYLLTRLKSLGVDHVFIFPVILFCRFSRKWTTVASLMWRPVMSLMQVMLQTVTTRLRGLAAVAATMAPAPLVSLMRRLAHCRKRVPVVFISGGPGNGIL